MKKAIIVLACATSLFAQFASAPVEVASIDTKISCRAAFDELKTFPRDAAADRTYAILEARIRKLEAEKEDKRNEKQIKSCALAVELFRAQLAKVELSQKLVDTQKEISLVKDSLIASWAGDVKSLGSSLERLSTESQKALSEKDQLIAKQKAEADKKLEALQSKTISYYKDARGTILSMSDILFESAKADLKPELKENLAEVAGILKTLLTESTIIVEGHTDNVGKDATNLKLSQNRSAEVVKYLTTRGVDKKRLKSVGYGKTKPVADNATDEGKAKNRRVELVIKDK
ncbi:MAG: OmpA family protein [Fibromonadales bacterium]|nr:OmpA family protein [Fibromonadales bacterium]